MAIYHDIMSNNYADIAQEFKVNPQKCANPMHYENFIKFDCHIDQKQGMGVTHVFIDEDDTGSKKIAGYIALRCSSLIMNVGEQYKLGYPALEIAELAVDYNYENHGLGTDMVKFAIGEAVKMNENMIGIQYVILCADIAAVEFYSNRELKFSPIRQMQEIPRKHRNSECVPMMLKIVQY